MNKELYVSSTPHETKVALVEDDQVSEVFFERENEYTLAGSIYKGRVTRVLPGMQSAFVDIGLERDAFLYVSDFLELTGEEDSEEFGDIPAPPPSSNLGSSARPAEESVAAAPVADENAEFIAAVEDLAEGDSEGETEGGAVQQASGEETQTGDGARRWRGRRRRGGRRVGREERLQRPETRTEAAETPSEPVVAEAAPESRPTPESRPAPARYAPMVLPGESISKYRNLSPEAPVAQVASEEASTVVAEAPLPTVVEDFVPQAQPVVEEQAEYEVFEGVVETAAVPQSDSPLHQSFVEVRKEEAKEVVPAVEAVPEVVAEAAAIVGPDIAVKEVEQETETETSTSPEPVEATEHGTIEVTSNAAQERQGFVERTESDQELHQEAAPLEAPVGRTLEHETLEDDEMEFHPMPENLEAMSEVAGDLELELEEETLDDDNGYSDRWIPKVADVDEDDVVAAEERGETRFPAGEEESEEDESGEEEGNGRAEVRAATPTAGYQQRQTRRSGEGDRDRRGGRNFRGRRNNVRANAHRPQPLISELLKEGQEILIQIAKEPIAKKGARITSHIALPGRFLVYMPTVNHTGVSRKINSEEERQRLKRIVTSERENGIGGFIVRTAAANIKEDELRADIRFLKHLWAEIKTRADNGKSPALIYHDLNLVERILRDQVSADFSQIWVDTEEEYERVVRFAQRFQPSLVRRIKLYTKTTPLYEHFGIQDQINDALKSKVWLKSGGYIVINQTEALVAIDINTGKYVGKTQRLEDTIVKTNIEAVKEIVRQVRLRDLGGIIVIDFIDMDERKNRQKVMQALEEALRSDRAPSKALQFNDFGLVAITRKRVKQSLERTLGEACPYCTGAGFVKSVPTVCNEIYIEMRKMIKAHDRTDVTLRVNPEVAKALKANNGKLITEMEELVGKTVLVRSDALLHQENFDIQ